MNIGGDLRLIIYFIDTATHCQRRKISFYTVWAHLRRSANGSNERKAVIRLGGVIYQGHTALTDYHSTPFQVLCLLDFEYVCFERRTVSFFTQFNSGIFPWY
jgi:hypothetical protein